MLSLVLRDRGPRREGVDEAEREERDGSGGERDALKHALQLVEEAGGGVTEAAHTRLGEGRRGAHAERKQYDGDAGPLEVETRHKPFLDMHDFGMVPV
ncbi:hypothetical protein HC928_25300 [bacterium]|nr:hypothetical protein [bacterium]